jgi:hypothetical protein
MQCQVLARYAIEVAKVHKVKSILFNGSFVQWPVARRLLQDCFLTGSLLSPLVAVSVGDWILPYVNLL